MISVRKYAAHRGVSPAAVSKAIKVGRLEQSIARDSKGQPKIVDVDAADEEWKRNTEPPEASAPISESSFSESSGSGFPSYADSRARREAARAGLMTLELMKARGRLVSVDGVRAAVASKFSEVKAKLLGVSAHLRQRSSTISEPDLALVHELIREALEALADEISTD